MHQYIGLILLIVAVAAALYLITNTDGIFNLGFNIPGITGPPVSLPEFKPVDDFPGSGKEIKKPAEKPVRIMSIRMASSFKPYAEVILASNLTRGEKINVTGWIIKSNSGSFEIPQAREIYSFGGAYSDIKLRSGDYLHLYSSRAAKGNFRLNKCLGYIEDLSPFTPPIIKKCPRIKRAEVTAFSSPCQEYLLSLRACKNPLANPPVPLDDFACHEFLRKLDYVGCVAKHRNDDDFLIDEWRVWLEDKINIFDPLHDKIQLLDRAGKIVDEYIY